jgi:endonuclease/exonuclease/phosphatase family metal-dependent hydrolase
MRLSCQYSLQVLRRVYRESFAPFASSSFVVYPVIACRAYPVGTTMRVVTWNMGCGPTASQFRKSHDEAWTYLLEELRPDVALVQEALVAKIQEARRDHSVTVCELGPNVAAGTAILVHGLESHGAPTAAISAHTYAATVEVSTPAGPLTALSAHVYPGEEQHADLKRLVEVLGTTFAGRTLLIGGDFNAARRFDKVYCGKRHGAFFTAMKTAGLHEVHWELHGREIQSFWGRQSKEAYQDDHFFVTTGWASRVRSCKVIDNEVVRRLSDHGPVEMELDVTAAIPPDDTSRLR